MTAYEQLQLAIRDLEYLIMDLPPKHPHRAEFVYDLLEAREKLASMSVADAEKEAA